MRLVLVLLAIGCCGWFVASSQLGSDPAPAPDAKGTDPVAEEGSPERLRQMQDPHGGGANETSLRVTGSVPSPSGAQAFTVDEHARITLAPDALWSDVKAALRLSAKIRSERELEEDPTAPYLVSLPGVEGYVTVGALRPGVGPWPGLRLYVGSVGLEAVTRAFAVGKAWLKAGPPGTPFLWRSEAWTPEPWRAALAHAKASPELPMSLRVRAEDDVPASTMIQMISEAQREHVRDMHIDTETDWADPTEDALAWLAAHQLPSGAWREKDAQGYCHGDPVPHAFIDAKLGPTDATPGLTGVVLCAFMHAGYTHRGVHPYARCVSRGFRYLKNTLPPDGAVSTAEAMPNVRAQAWATLAITSIYNRTRSPIFRNPAARAQAALSRAWQAGRTDPLTDALASLSLALAQRINEYRSERNQAPVFESDERFEHRLLADWHTRPTNSAGRLAGLAIRLALADEAGRRAAATEAQATGDSMLTSWQEHWLRAHVGYTAGGTAHVAAVRAHNRAALEYPVADGDPCLLHGSCVALGSEADARVLSTALFAFAGAYASRSK